MMTRVAVLAAGLLVAGTGCHEKQEVTPPPPPLRPEAEATSPKALAAQKDCEPTDSEPKPLSFDERSIPEGNRLAEQGKAKLRTAQSAEVARPTREDMTTQAVDDFITALRADPYNVEATYSLAAAYATIPRPQCTINLLGCGRRRGPPRQAPGPQAGARSRLLRDAQGRTVPRPDPEDVRRHQRCELRLWCPARQPRALA